MKDPYNPMHDELRDWAFDPNAVAPTQDFDLMVADIINADVILELAADETCPNRGFFLGCAYLIVGDAIRTKHKTASKAEIKEFLQQAEKIDSDLLKIFVADARDLIKNPGKFTYNQWCDHGLARKRLKGE